MRAIPVNKIERFTRGGDPYRKLRVGSHDPKTAVDTMVEILGEFFNVEVGFVDEQMTEISATLKNNIADGVETRVHPRQVTYFSKSGRWSIHMPGHRKGITKTDDINKVLPMLIEDIFGSVDDMSRYISNFRQKMKETAEEIKNLNKMIDVLKRFVKIK